MQAVPFLHKKITLWRKETEKEKSIMCYTYIDTVNILFISANTELNRRVKVEFVWAEPQIAFTLEHSGAVHCCYISAAIGSRGQSGVTAKTCIQF